MCVTANQLPRQVNFFFKYKTIPTCSFLVEIEYNCLVTYLTWPSKGRAGY